MKKIHRKFFENRVPGKLEKFIYFQENWTNLKILLENIKKIKRISRKILKIKKCQEIQKNCSLIFHEE